MKRVDRRETMGAVYFAKEKKKANTRKTTTDENGLMGSKKGQHDAFFSGVMEDLGQMTLNCTGWTRTTGRK